jgi:hypothetical protein
MSQNGIAILQSVDLRNNYAAWLPNVWTMKVGGFYDTTDETVNKTGSYMANVIPYHDANGFEKAVGFADEEIGPVRTSTDTLYNLTLGDEAGREVTLCLRGTLYLKNAHASKNIKIGEDIAPHPSGVQLADTISQTVIGKALMPVAYGYYGMFYIDLVSQRVITKATGF